MMERGYVDASGFVMSDGSGWVEADGSGYIMSEGGWIEMGG
jgi:hypothetical protein